MKEQSRVNLYVAALSVILLVLLMSPRFTWSQESAAPSVTDENVVELIRNAKTAADHRAIAAYYQKKADEAKALADKHKKLENAYHNNPSIRSAGPDFMHVYMGHCATLSRADEAEARQYEALAKLHLKMADQMKK